MKFEIGKTYTTRLITNHDSIISFYVIKRTDKTVTVTGDFMDTNAAERQAPHTMRLKLSQVIETFKPWGTYSMCPVVSADREQKGQHMTANQQALEALIELSSLFDNYPQLYEMIGTYQKMNAAIDRLIKDQPC